MAIKEIKKWVTENGAEFSTLQAAQKYEKMKEYQIILQRSGSYYSGELHIEDIDDLCNFLSYNKHWILDMMDWAELDIDLSKED